MPSRKDFRKKKGSKQVHFNNKNTTKTARRTSVIHSFTKYYKKQ